MYYLRIFIESFLSIFAIMRLTGMSCRSPFSAIFFIIIMYVFAHLHSDRVEGHVISGDKTLAALIGALFTAFTMAARYPVILGGMTSSLFRAGMLLITCAGLLTIYYYFVIWFLQTAARADFTTGGYSCFGIPFLAFAACIICWLPYFLYEYPAVMTPDSTSQYAQVIGAWQLNSHHPVVHTALIGLFYNIGLSITGDIHMGIALYTLAQMVFMAFAAGYVVRTLQKASVIVPVQMAAICFYALMPYNGIYSVTMWADVPFAGFMTIFAASLMRFLLRGSFAPSSDAVPKLRVSEYFTLLLPYIISAVMICLLRTNGWYALALSIPFILITYCKWLKVLLPVHIIIISLVMFVKYPVMYVYEIPQDDFAESVSVPARQIASVIYSDNPKACLDAYIAQTNGYWYPDGDCETGIADGICQNGFGLTWQPILYGSAIVKIREILFKLPEIVPLYGLLWSMGFALWLILLAAALSLRMRRPANALVCFPFIMLYATLFIATPVATDFRYAYAAFYALPLLVVSPFAEK